MFSFPQASPLSPILYLVFTHDLPPTSKVFRSIFADDLKYFVAGPNLSIITTKLQQSMDDLAAYANQWRIGLNAGKTSKLLSQHSSRYLSDWHITLLGKAIRSVIITFDTMLSFTKHFHAIANLARHRLLKLLSLSTSTHGPSPSTTISQNSRTPEWIGIQIWYITPSNRNKRFLFGVSYNMHV